MKTAWTTQQTGSARLATARLATAFLAAAGLAAAGLAATGLACAASPAAPLPPTRPEATHCQETSRYEDVMSYLRAAVAANPQLKLTTYGYTTEGRALPLVVVGAPDATPAAVLQTGKVRIFLQANIHAGEVEGKEAMLWLLRDLAGGAHAEWFKDVVLLIAPIYNADGNERVDVRNRGPQYGPEGGMGQRHNAQDLDLNRDCTKLETAEARSMARLLCQYDPQVCVDMHTTDGSDHGYYLTYEAPGNPSTAAGVVALARQELLPAVTSAVKAKHGWNLFYYGGPSDRPERGWYADADLYKLRYHHNYFGIRNRIGILSEAYSYATFEDRIKATLWFVEEIVSWVAAHADQVRATCANADAEVIIGREHAVRGTLERTADAVDIVLADTQRVRNPYVPDSPMRVRVDSSQRVERMPYFGTIKATETSKVPAAYVIPAATGEGSAPTRRMLASVKDRLESHGVRFTVTDAPRIMAVERFQIKSNTLDAQPYRGGGEHRLRTLTGEWHNAQVEVPAGSLIIPMNQPLARLAFVLLDPRSDDGFMAWNILDPVLGATPGPEQYPVLRTMAP
ncbi:MAG: M14 family metallopeptidase [Phycisphaerales bacterium]